MLHPIITEILFAVPTEGGDANGDGVRDATGDEFIELVNWSPHPLQMSGYTLTDRHTSGRGQMKFVFPAFELPPWGVAVVFNGRNQTWKGPVGDSTLAPPGPNELFHGAWVFTMRNESEMVGLSNSGDCVVLWAPTGEAISCVVWGDVKVMPEVPAACVVRVEIPRNGSVQRSRTTGRFQAHRDLAQGALSLPFSPGRFPWPPEEGAAPGAGSK
ncbi:MAG: lamin tail domain-containing protein [Phycisphaeraceae bacterium]|nr:lamin tail domain-containing protein [Phycisphaeraceae bacterium]